MAPQKVDDTAVATRPLGAAGAVGDAASVVAPVMFDGADDPAEFTAFT